MGQRLNIEIVNGDTPLVNCYYHWSAYTESALRITAQIIDEYYESESIVGLKMAVELLEATGGGVNKEEREAILKSPEKFGHINFKDAVDRNRGLISVTEGGMEETRKWEEGRVTIDLGSETFNFETAWFDPFDVYVEDCCDEDEDVKIEDFVKCPYDLACVPFSEIDGLISLVNLHPDGVLEDEDTIIHWIG